MIQLVIHAKLRRKLEKMKKIIIFLDNSRKNIGKLCLRNMREGCEGLSTAFGCEI
jgi:hypothetical protein